VINSLNTNMEKQTEDEHFEKEGWSDMHINYPESEDEWKECNKHQGNICCQGCYELGKKDAIENHIRKVITEEELSGKAIEDFEKKIDEIEEIINTGSINYTKCQYCKVLIGKWLQANRKIKELKQSLKELGEK